MALALGACAEVESSKPQGDTAHVPTVECATSQHSLRTQLQYDYCVRASRVAALEASIESLNRFRVTKPDAEFLRLMAIPDARPETLLAWLKARARVVVDEEFDFGQRAWLTSDHQYENPGELPGFAAARGEIVMVNRGTALYFEGKKRNRLVQVKVDGMGMLPITSPRVGLLQIGRGLFNSAREAGSSEFQNIFRAMTLFHEARHGDGHGKWVGFPHSLCKVGHEYEGIYACDLSSNGPYTIGALMTKALMNACTDCTLETKHALNIVYADNLNRILRGDVTIPGNPPKRIPNAVPEELDPAPEGISQ